MTDGPIVAVEPAPHEFDGNAIFPTLDPWFAADRIVKDHDGSYADAFEIDAERWTVALSFTYGNLLPPDDGVTSEGTRVDHETIREFRLKVERADDDAGQQSFSVHMAPRWDNLKGETKTGGVREIPTPPNLGDGVNIRVQGSNIRFQRYLPLLKAAFDAVGINPGYLTNLHPASNVQDAEMYVRIDDAESGPIHARDGPIASLAHLLESDRDGYRKLVQNDRDGDGNQLAGYYHTVTLGQKRIQEAFPSHRIPKEIKHYYARHASNLSKENPLAHPKLGASYQSSRWDDTLRWTDLDELERELTETVLSVLADAGLSLRPRDRAGDDTTPYVTDAYFDAETTTYDQNPVTTLDLTRIRSSQESVVIRHIADGLSPVEWESLHRLVTDGGDVSPAEIADEYDRHPGSVRRALRRLEELVDREYGSVSIQSNYVAELVHDAVMSSRRAVETAGKALNAAERGLDDATSALVAWKSRYGIHMSESQDDYVRLEFGTLDVDDISEAKRQIRRALRRGRKLWTDAQQEPSRFIGGEYAARVTYDKFADSNYLSEETTVTLSGIIGKELAR